MLARLRGIQAVHAAIFFLYIGVVAVGYVRILWLSFEGIWFIAILLFFYAFAADATLQGRKSQFMRDLGTGLFIYVAINLIGHFVGITNLEESARYTRDFDSICWLFDKRIYYPFTNSTRYFSILAGLSMIFVLFGSEAKSNWKDSLQLWVMASMCLLALLGASARMPLMILAIVIFLGLFWRRIDIRITGLILTLLLALPFLVLLFHSNGIIGDYFKLSPNEFIRVGSDLMKFSNRHIIWSKTITKMAGLSFTSMFGYGAYGHILSGLSKDYGFLFEVSYAEPYVKTVHNSLLQNLVDYGFFGAALFLMLIVFLFISMAKGAEAAIANSAIWRVRRLLMLSLLYLVGCASTDASLTYMAPDIFGIFLVMNFLTMLNMDPTHISTAPLPACIET